MNNRVSRRLAWVAVVSFLSGGMALTALSFHFYNNSSLFFYFIFWSYFLHGITFSLIMLTLSYFGLRRNSEVKKLPALKKEALEISIAIPVYNEAQVILSCIASLLKQSIVPAEIIVINDGSSDETLALLKQTYQLRPIAYNNQTNIKTNAIIAVYESPRLPQLRVIDKERGGKADALNAALNLAKGKIFITVDADSFLLTNAIENLATAIIRDEKVVAAGGMVKAVNGVDLHTLNTEHGQLPQGWLPKLQWIEYATGFIWRFGWGVINNLLLLSGSFSGFRAALLKECGGFDPKSITEDYEITYRIHAHQRAHQRPYRIITVATALAYTLVPETVHSLLQQRIRWFQGFLQTLFGYRRLVFDQGYGWLGIFTLPIKCIDAITPIWGIAAYLILFYNLTHRQFPVPYSVLLALVAFQWIVDILMAWLLLTIDRRFIKPRLSLLQTAYLWSLVPVYLLVNRLMWYIYSFGAYYRLLQKIQRWDKVTHQGFVKVYSVEDKSLS